MCGSASGAMPWPVSETLIVIRPPGARFSSSRTRPPASVYLTALSVSTTISSRRRSPSPRSRSGLSISVSRETPRSSAKSRIPRLTSSASSSSATSEIVRLARPASPCASRSICPTSPPSRADPQAPHHPPAEHQQEPPQRLALRLRAAANLHQQLGPVRPLQAHDVDAERVALRRLAVREGVAIRQRVLERPLAGEARRVDVGRPGEQLSVWAHERVEVAAGGERRTGGDRGGGGAAAPAQQAGCQ